MEIRQRIVGSVQGRDVESYVLDGGDIVAEVWGYGATLVEVRVPDRSGRWDNVVVRLPDLAGYQAQRAYVGATVGRYCRSIKDSRFRLDGVEHVLPANQGGHHVHGGPVGFDRHVWEARTEVSDDYVAVRLRHNSPDGDQGYPGNLTVEAGFVVHTGGRLVFEYSARTDRPTVVGLTNHAFWNLAGSGVVDDQVLALNSTRTVAFDDEQMPLPGDPRPLAGTRLDHREPRRIGTSELDDFYVLDDPAWAAELADPASGRVMRVTTDQPGLGVYSGDHYTRPRAGLCLEAGPWPDAPNRPDFPSVRLDPGEVHRHRTVHEFSVHEFSVRDFSVRDVPDRS